jgi:hypothetical protein
MNSHLYVGLLIYFSEITLVCCMIKLKRYNMMMKEKEHEVKLIKIIDNVVKMNAKLS